MHWQARLTKYWAYLSMGLVTAIILFLFGYVFYRGADTISWEFLTQAPSGAVLGEEGGIWPAIVGSICFPATAIVLGSIPAIATALYMVFYCKNRRIKGLIRMVVQCISGIPSIVLGLFAYSFLVRDLAWGRCILSSGVALAIMILPFIEVRAEKTFHELPPQMVQSSYALGCSRWYTVWNIILPACKGELVSGIILGGCYAMGATAPMIFTGAVAYASVPKSLMEPAMALPMHLYLLLAQGTTSMDTAYGTAFVMMALILLSNGNHICKEEPEKMESIMTLDRVGASYDGKPALEDISMEIFPHSITAIIGPSGCGKSTLLRCMNGLLKEESGAAVSGNILLKGQDIVKMEPEEVRRRVGLVFQTPSPFPFSIYKNMTYALRYYGVKDKKELDRQVKEKLQMAGLYDEVAQELDKSAHKLSGGQQQRLCIARALTVEPEILLLDEPCSALDVKSSSVIEKMLTQLKEKYTIVIVTHNIAQARRISDHVAFLFGGKLIEFAPAKQIFSQPKEEETKAFLEGIYG